MKKILHIIFCIGIIGALVCFIDPITDTLANLLTGVRRVFINRENDYAKKYDFKYIQLSDGFVPYDYQDLLNIYYTIFNNGAETFTFYCPEEYTDCLDDVAKISDDRNTLTNISNFVHPFNAFTDVTTERDSSGTVTLKVNHLYTDDEIEEVNDEIDKIMGAIVSSDMDVYEKIKVFHDFIINNTKYEKPNDTDEISSVAKATGTLFEHKASCSGYADTMAIFLSKINVKNYKVTSQQHVWNALYLEDEKKWVHLDLTWDDPVTLNSDADTLLHKFFLIDTETLKNFNTEEHDFDSKIYQEL